MGLKGNVWSLQGDFVLHGNKEQIGQVRRYKLDSNCYLSLGIPTQDVLFENDT